jgi:hypothetical protein
VTTAVSATHIGYGTLRLEPVRMSLGQAAAAAAYASIFYSVEPRNAHPAWIQDKILDQDSYITWNSDVTRETRHFKAINFIGARGMLADEAFRPDAPLTANEAVAALNLLVELEGGAFKLPAPEDDAKEITRGEFARLLVEVKQSLTPDWQFVEPSRPSYKDVPADSPYFAAVETLKAHWIESALFAGAAVDEFDPDSTLTRADAAEAVYLAHREAAMGEL